MRFWGRGKNEEKLRKGEIGLLVFAQYIRMSFLKS